MCTELNPRDKAILNCVFNPHLPLESASNHLEDELKDHEEDSNEIRSCTDMEIKAIKFAESGNLDQALLMINEAIHLVPFKPSLYNNRAHIYQYMRKFEVPRYGEAKDLSYMNFNFQRLLYENVNHPFQYIIKNELQDIYPNVYLVVRIALTKPVNTAFPSVKNYLRNCMKQGRLSPLEILSIDAELAFNNTISYKSLLDDFSNVKCRTALFL